MSRKVDLKLKVRTHFLLVLLALLFIVVAIYQGLYDWHVYRQNNDVLAGQPIIANLLDNAVNNLNAPAPVMAQSGQVYFPDVHLVLPAPGQDYALRQIEYANVSDSASLDLQVTSKGIMSEAETKLLTAQADAQGVHQDAQGQLAAIFRQVPSLQACARGVQLFSDPQNGSDYKLQFTKELSSGKTLYAYTDTSSTCHSQQFPALINYLKQIQSY